MAITWNVVNKTGESLDAVQDELRGRITRLEKLLAHFPEDAVHLQSIFLPRRKDKLYPVTLNLRIPSDVLQVKKAAPSLSAAVNEAIAALATRLERLRSRYRRDHAWKGRRSGSLPEKAVAFADGPLAEGARPQAVADLIEPVLQEDYGRLIEFVRRQLHEYVLSGMVPRDVIDTEDIVHRVVEKALAEASLKPTSMDYYTWCSSLAFQYTRDAVQRFAEENDTAMPVDLDVDLDVDEIAQEGIEPEEYALNLLRQKLEPGETTLADTIPDPQAPLPDAHLHEQEVVAGMRKMVRNWPRLERQVFEMHFLEGFSADDLAATFECNRSTVERVLRQVRARLRTRLASAVSASSANAMDSRTTTESRARAKLDPDRGLQRDAATTKTRSEFDALLIAMRRLESSLASAAPHRQTPWRNRVRDDFRAVYSALLKHGESARSPDGLFAEIQLARPEMERRVNDLTRRQKELMDLAGELEQAIAQDPDVSDFATIRSKAADLLLMIRHQHAQETDLIYEAFWQDLGGSE